MLRALIKKLRPEEVETAAQHAANVRRGKARLIAIGEEDPDRAVLHVASMGAKIWRESDGHPPTIDPGELYCRVGSYSDEQWAIGDGHARQYMLANEGDGAHEVVQ